MAHAAAKRGADVSSRAALVVGACALVLLTGNAERVGVSPFFEDFRALFGVDYAGAGALLSGYLFAYTLVQVPAGMAADRWDPRRVATVGLVGLGLSALVLALAPSYAVALGARCAMGVCAGIIFPSVMKLAVAATRGHGLALGVLESGKSLGTLAAVSAAPLLAQATSVSHALLGLALLPPLALLGLWLAVPASPPAGGGGQRMAVRELLGDRRFLRLAGLGFLILIVAYASLGWLPTYARTTLGLSRGEAGALMAVYTLVGFISAPLAGRLGDARKIHAPVLAFAAVASALAFVLFLSNHIALVVVGCVLAGAGTTVSIPLLWALVAETVAPHQVGAALGLGNTASQFASASSGLLYGALLDASGGSFAVIWVVAGALALLLAAGALRCKPAYA